MNDRADEQSGARPGSDLDRIDQLCEQFEDACKAGQGPRIEEYLDQVAEQDRPVLFEQLLPVELHWRRQRGEEPAQEEYRDRFAAYGQQIDAAFASKPAVDTPRREDWHIETHAIGARALHVRCPHCRNPIELVDDTPLAEITCPSCGSSFSLVGDEALAHRTAGGTRRRRQRVGHFELVEQLGAGAFGVVWRAQDTKLDRTVAVKIPRKGQLDREETEKFLREARAAAQLRHPNIVSVHEVGIEGDLLYIVSDFVEGLSLHDWRTGHKFGYRESAELCAKIAEALDYAHEQGVVHRDLKPTNVLLDRSGEVHLMDFGLAKREAGEVTMTTEGQILGTPAYMSPEQARGEAHQADRRTDVYSLGVILYELLTGELPFRGNLRMMLKQVLEDNPPSLRKLDGNIPRDLETICLKCLEKDPDRRYPRARELADELRRYLDGKPIHARPIGRGERAWRWCRRNPVVAGLLAAVAVSLVSGTVVSTRFAIVAGRRASEAQEAEQEALDLANEKTELAAREQAARAEETRQRLLLLQQQALESVRNAWQAFDEGDEPTMLIWLADAYRTSDRVARTAADDPGLDEAAKRQIEWQREVNRMRMASALQHYPLAHIWPGVRAGAFSHDGRFAATGSHDGDVVVYELSTGREVHRWKTKDLGGPTEEPLPEAAAGLPYPIHAVLRISFSPDDRLLMTVTPKAVQLWDLSTGEGRLSECDENVTRACFVDEGRAVLACLRDRKLRRWDVRPGSDVLERQAAGEVLRFSADGRRLAVRSASGEESTTLSILDAASGETVATLQTGPHVRQALFSPDATRLALLRAIPKAPFFPSRVVEIWDIGQGERLSTWEPCEPETVGERETISAAAFSPDGKRLAAATADVEADGYRVRLWDCATGEPLGPPMEQETMVSDMAFAPDGQLLAVAGGVTGHDATRGDVRLWDPRSGTPIGSSLLHSRPAVQLQLGVHGRYLLAIGDYTDRCEARLWEAARFSKAARPLEVSDPDAVVGFTPDGRLIVAIEGDRRQAWRSDTLEPVTLPEEMQQFVAVPHTRFVHEQVERSYRFLHPSGASEVRTRAYTVVREVTEYTKTLRAIALPLGAAGKKPAKLEVPDHYRVIHTDGTLRVTANTLSPGEARVWDASSGKPITRAMKHHSGVVSSAAFAAKGRLLLVHTADGSFRIWDVTTSLPVTRSIRHGARLRPVAFSADGNRVITTVMPKGELPVPPEPQAIPPAPHPGEAGNRAAADQDVWRVWELFPELEQTAEELFQRAEIISRSTIDATRTVEPLGSDEERNQNRL